MPEETLRYLGLAIESSSYGEDVADPDLHIDITGSSLDSPSEPFIAYEGGIGRMPANAIPGPYAPAGGTDFAASISSLAYLLHLALGVSEIDTTNVSTVSDEDHSTGVGETEKDFTLASAPVIQGSFELNDGVTTVYATDDGWGKIVESGGSGISGWIDYSTGDVHLEGLTESTTYEVDYESGYYIHTITPVLGNNIPSFNAFVGKDIFEHKFLGCIINTLNISIEQELCDMAIDVLAQKDKKETITPIEDLLLTSNCHGERQRSFADCQLKVGDFGGSLSDISAKVRAFTAAINNNGSTEDNIGLNSRFPQDGTVEALTVTGTITLQFENTDYLEDFWGDAGGAVDGDPQLKALELTIDGGGVSGSGWGSGVISLGRVLLQSVGIQPSGKEKLMQELAYAAEYDCDSEEIIQAVIQNFNRLHNPA